jgi:hypothetical protein
MCLDVPIYVTPRGGKPGENRALSVSRGGKLGEIGAPWRRSDGIGAGRCWATMFLTGRGGVGLRPGSMTFAAGPGLPVR